MPVKVKAKDHSQYMRTSHKELTHAHHVKKPLNDPWKIIIFYVIVLLIAAGLIVIADAMGGQF